MSFVLLASVGLVITTTAAYNQKTMHQDALDAAVLACASLIDASEEDRIQEARRTYAANLKSSGLAIESSELLSATQDAAMFAVRDWTVTGHVRAEVKNFFSGFIGDKSVGVVVQAAAQAGAAEPVCVLALDPVSPQGFEVYGTRPIHRSKLCGPGKLPEWTGNETIRCGHWPSAPVWCQRRVYGHRLLPETNNRRADDPRPV